MRKVETLMIAAMQGSKSWHGVNTSVVVEPTPGAPSKYFTYLHGNLIARMQGGELEVTLAGWATPTTRSRVNAILRTFANYTDPLTGRSVCYGMSQKKGWQRWSCWTCSGLPYPAPLDYRTVFDREITATEWVRP